MFQNLMISPEEYLWYNKGIIATITLMSSTILFLKWKIEGVAHRPLAIMCLGLSIAYATDYWLCRYTDFHSLMLHNGSSFGSVFIAMLLIGSSYIYMLQVFKPSPLTLKLFVKNQIPFMVGFSGYIILIAFGLEPIKNLPICNVLGLVSHDLFAFWWLLCFITVVVSGVSINMMVLKMVMTHHRNIKNNFSSSCKRIYFNIFTLYILYGVMFLYGLFYMSLDLSVRLQSYSFCFFALLLYLIFIFTYLQKDIYSESSPLEDYESENNVDETSVSPHPLRATDKRLLDLIAIMMEQDHIYTDMELTTEEFSRRQGVSRKKLYLLLKEYYKTSFSNFINQHRLNYAECLMSDKGNSHLLLLQISEQAGFNSFTTFNNSFKAKHQITLAKFRIKILNCDK